MNRSILIVICDFLLVSLLAFSSPDINKIADEGAPPQVKVDIATNQLQGGKDLTAVMRLALEEERKNRNQLLGELTQTRGTLGERERQLQTAQQELRSRQQQQANLQQQQATLQQQFASAQTNIQTLTEKLQTSSTEGVISREKLEAMEAELRKQAEQAAAYQRQIDLLARSNQLVLNEKQRLAGQLEVAQVEKRHATEQNVRLQEEVKVERAEKAKLAEGVKTLASKSGELVQEIRENRALSPNTIFSEFVSNRVEARISVSRPGLFGTHRQRDTVTVLVSDGTNTFALCHVDSTPLTLWNPGTRWDGITGTFVRNTAQIPINALSFHLQDPRVVFMPVSAADARQLGGKIYRISTAPFKFQDAVLVGAGEGYYGECKFEIDLSTPAYAKLDRSVLRGLFGKFNPSRGDLVFSRMGELLGIMANNTYCLLIHSFDSTATINFGQDLQGQNTATTLAALYSVVQQMPLKLQ
jgi:hypothetical protein